MRASYIRVLAPDHPRQVMGKVSEHVLVAEKALGKFLPPNAVVHHVNGNTRDNRACNLVICQDQSYHMLLHQRQRRLERYGSPDLVRHCRICGQAVSVVRRGRCNPCRAYLEKTGEERPYKVNGHVERFPDRNTLAPCLRCGRNCDWGSKKGLRGFCNSCYGMQRRPKKVGVFEITCSICSATAQVAHPEIAAALGGWLSLHASKPNYAKGPHE